MTRAELWRGSGEGDIGGEKAPLRQRATEARVCQVPLDVGCSFNTGVSNL